MVSLLMCRICLTENIRMFSIAKTYLQETYEKLTGIPFDTNNDRPLQVCYICRARLRNCHQLRVNCLESEEQLNRMLRNNCLKLKPLQYSVALKIQHPMVCLSCGPMSPEVSDDVIQPVQIKYDIQVKMENVEDTEENITDELTSVEYVEVQNMKTENVNAEDNLLDYIAHAAEETDNLSIEDNIKEENIVTELEDIKSNDVIRIEIQDKVLLKNDFNKKTRRKSAKIAMKTIVPYVNTNQLIAVTSELVAVKESIEVTSQNEFNTAVKFNHNDITYKIQTKEKNTTEEKLNIIKKPYKCKLCDKSYSHKSTLRSHNGTHTGLRYICDICNRSFNEKSGLKKHIRIHTGENPYKCEICGKGFKQNCNLIVHRLIHTGDKPYKCDVCDRCFTHKHTLNCHLRIHSDDKPFKCDVCNKCFRVRQTLRKHAVIHDNERRYKCTTCEKGFKFKTHLRQHNRVHKIKNVIYM